MNSCIACKQKVSRRCVKACDTSYYCSDCKNSCTVYKQRAFLQCEWACESSDFKIEWMNSHTAHNWKASLLNGFTCKSYYTVLFKSRFPSFSKLSKPADIVKFCPAPPRGQKTLPRPSRIRLINAGIVIGVENVLTKPLFSRCQISPQWGKAIFTRKIVSFARNCFQNQLPRWLTCFTHTGEKTYKLRIVIFVENILRKTLSRWCTNFATVRRSHL